MALKGFICYASKDTKEVLRLETYLQVMRWSLGVEFWIDRLRLEVGERWSTEIENAISTSDIYVLALSPDWFASKYISGVEWPAIQKQAHSNTKLQAPILLKDCPFEEVFKGPLDLQVSPIHPKYREPTSVTSRRWSDGNGYTTACRDLVTAIKKRFDVEGGLDGPQTGAGLQFTTEVSSGGESPSYGMIAREIDASDASAIQQPFVRQLLVAAASLVNDLKEITSALDNQPSWRRFAHSVGTLAELLRLPAPEFPGRLAEAYVSLQSLVVARDLNTRIRSGWASEDPALDTNQAVLLDESVEVVATLLGCFPSVLNGLAKGRSAVFGVESPIESSVALIQAALQKDVLNSGSASFMLSFVELALDNSDAANPVRQVVSPSSRNLASYILAATTLAARGSDSRPSLLEQKVKAFVRENRELLLSANAGDRSTEAAIALITERLEREQEAAWADVSDPVETSEPPTHQDVDPLASLFRLAADPPQNGTPRAAKILEIQAEVARQLEDWSTEDKDEHFARGYAPYWLSLPIESLVRHAKLVARAERGRQPLAIEFNDEGLGGLTELSIYTLDTHGLVSRLVGSMAIAQATVVEATLFTLANGMAMHRYLIQDEERRAFSGPERQRQLSAQIEIALSNRQNIPGKLQSRISSWADRFEGAVQEPRIIVDNDVSATSTVIGVCGPAIPGLLFFAARELTRLNLHVTQIYQKIDRDVAAFVFVVKDLFGFKTVRPEKIDQISETLSRSLLELQTVRPL